MELQVNPMPLSARQALAWMRMDEMPPGDTVSDRQSRMRVLGVEYLVAPYQHDIAQIEPLFSPIISFPCIDYGVRAHKGKMGRMRSCFFDALMV